MLLEVATKVLWCFIGYKMGTLVRNGWIITWKHKSIKVTVASSFSWRNQIINHSVVKLCPVETTRDMMDYINPLVGKNLYASLFTNRSKWPKSHKDPSDVESTKFANHSKIEVVISSLIPRGERQSGKQMKVNSDLKTWQFILQGKYKNFIILGNVL